MKIAAVVSLGTSIAALVGSIAAGLIWIEGKIDNLVTKKELQIVHLDIRISMDEKTLAELDYQLDSGKDLSAGQVRTYEQLKESVPAMTRHRLELIGL